ncbi:hypothetical protein VTN31DRAFT_2291 [Thermomyces dupontii]|uniref:uncharacterized protein n=1 Tax=Talaromyces thermophilus TaxID=28565 RepID=UPI0037438E81
MKPSQRVGSRTASVDASNGVLSRDTDLATRERWSVCRIDRSLSTGLVKRQACSLQSFFFPVHQSFFFSLFFFSFPFSPHCLSLLFLFRAKAFNIDSESRTVLGNSGNTTGNLVEWLATYLSHTESERNKVKACFLFCLPFGLYLPTCNDAKEQKDHLKNQQPYTLLSSTFDTRYPWIKGGRVR